jgi:hypothetical protein
VNVGVKSIVFIDMISPSNNLRFNTARLPVASLRERERGMRFADRTDELEYGYFLIPVN